MKRSGVQVVEQTVVHDRIRRQHETTFPPADGDGQGQCRRLPQLLVEAYRHRRTGKPEAEGPQHGETVQRDSLQAPDPPRFQCDGAVEAEPQAVDEIPFASALRADHTDIHEAHARIGAKPPVVVQPETVGVIVH